MSWFDYILIGIWLLAPIVRISEIGKPRKPVTAGDAIVSVVVTALFIGALLFVRGVL